MKTPVPGITTVLELVLRSGRSGTLGSDPHSLLSLLYVMQELVVVTTCCHDSGLCYKADMIFPALGQWRWLASRGGGIELCAGFFTRATLLNTTNDENMRGWECRWGRCHSYGWRCGEGETAGCHSTISQDCLLNPIHVLWNFGVDVIYTNLEIIQLR